MTARSSLPVLTLRRCELNVAWSFHHARGRDAPAPPRGTRKPAMLFWSSKQRVGRRRAEEKAADQLMFDFGDEAYGEARCYEREAYGLEAAAYWRHVALAVAHKTGQSLIVHTATPTLD
jgi:hypothetical protein